MKALKEIHSNVSALRDVTLDELKQIEGKVDNVVYRRALHVVTENDRCREFAASLKNGDYISAGKLMFASHDSLDKDYEVSCNELNFLVESLKNQKGVLGARMTGGGFGGSTVALVKKENVEEVQRVVSELYTKKFEKSPDCIVTKACDGARSERF